MSDRSSRASRSGHGRRAPGTNGPARAGDDVGDGDLGMPAHAPQLELDRLAVGPGLVDDRSWPHPLFAPRRQRNDDRLQLQPLLSQPVLGRLAGEPAEYGLTQKGLELKPVIIALTAWGEKWVRPGPVVYQTRSDGQPVELQLRRVGRHAQVSVADVVARPRRAVRSGSSSTMTRARRAR